MRNGWKYALLAAALCLCFALTGCYIAPDDVNTGEDVPTSNALPFDTLPPKNTEATTPDTVAVPTQNVFGTAQGGAWDATPTPAPGSAGWTDWGVVQTGEAAGTETPMPSSLVFEDVTPIPGALQTIAVVTASPSPTRTVIPVTPTPTPGSLQMGFKGSDEVRALQRKLKALGYYSGSVDGDFGAATEKAVREFQKANGLTADGKAGSKTLAKLNSKDAVSAKQAKATAKATAKTTAKAKATATPKPTVKKTATPKPTVKKTATPKPTATPNLTKEYYLSLGSKGARVKTLQKRLVELGWLSGSVSGEFDAATEAAVRAFQNRTKGLWEDGIAGPDTLQALYSSDAARSKTPAASVGETLESGSEGAAVRKLQQKLKDLGYLSGSVDGSFGVATEAAVIAFQKNNHLTADGKAGTETLSKLYSGSAVKAAGSAAKITSSEGGRDTKDISSTGYATLSRGDQGTQVRNLQRRLKDLGYYTGSVDGSFGESTEAAVMAFQLRNYLTVDGKAGPATQRVLYGTSGAIAYAAMDVGEEGSDVKNLQYTLYELGYYDGSIDGFYGLTTSDAVRAFQIQNKLKVDGKAGSETLSRLYSKDAIPATAAAVSYDAVRPGDKGNDVVEVQDCLVQMGYLAAVTGEYDEATVAAVKAFQAANGLEPDGVCGEKTLVVLFGY